MRTPHVSRGMHGVTLGFRARPCDCLGCWLAGCLCNCNTCPANTAPAIRDEHLTRFRYVTVVLPSAARSVQRDQTRDVRHLPPS